MEAFFGPGIRYPGLISVRLTSLPSVKTFTLTPTQTLMTLIQTLMTLIRTLMTLIQTLMTLILNEVYLEERSSVEGGGHRAVTPAEHNSETQTGGPEEAGAHQVLFGFA